MAALVHTWNDLDSIQMGVAVLMPKVDGVLARVLLAVIPRQNGVVVREGPRDPAGKKVSNSILFFLILFLLFF